jgi:hypothetical protein
MADVHSLSNPARAQWNHPLSHSDYTKMLRGFKPADMDDRWMIITDTPDKQGNTVVHVYRSWTSIEKTGGKAWATIVEIAWDKYPGEQEVTEEEIKELAPRLCRGLLECEFKR